MSDSVPLTDCRAMKMFLAGLAVPILLASQTPAEAGEVCVKNADRHTFLFVAEAREGDRIVARLAPGELLCAKGVGRQVGVVSVFESAEQAEGCSRLVAAPGGTRILHRYVSFDRCAWDDNTN